MNKASVFFKKIGRLLSFGKHGFNQIYTRRVLILRMTQYGSARNERINRIIEIQKLTADEQKTVFPLLYAFLRDTKTHNAYAS